MTTPEDTLLLWQAIEAHDDYELQHILTNALPEATDQLRGSVKRGRLEVVRRLIERGADVNALRADGFTPLLLAVFFGHLDVVKLLVEHGADLTACTRFGTSAEMWAQARGFQEIIDYLHDYQEKSLQLANSSLQNGEWFKESLVAEPVIEEPTIPSALLQSNEDDDDDDDERTLVRPVINHESTTDESVAAKVLKDPPEIWDLVHENRNSFNPRAAFLSHLESSKARIALLALLIVVIAGVIGFATMRLEGGRSAPAIKSVESRKPDSAAQPEKLNQQSATLPPEEAQPPSRPSAIVSTQAVSDINQIRSSRQNRRTIQSASTSSSATETPNNIPTEKVTTASETKTPAPLHTVTVTATLDADVAAKKTPDSNSKLIQKSSAAQPRKPRVIQWP